MAVRSRYRVSASGVTRVERDGWRLVLALPDSMQRIGEELMHRVVAIAAGQEGEALRRSRHATTFNLRFRAETEASTTLNLFVKVMDAPRGIEKLKRRLRGSRSRHVARVTARLAALGIAAPPVLIYGRAGDGRELMVSPRAEGRGPLRTLATLSQPEKRRILYALGVEIARIHRAGFVHGDLTPFNIFVVCDEPPRFVFFDHERTRRNFAIGARRRAIRNLVQLGRFGIPGITLTDRVRVVRSYSVAMKFREPRKTIRRAAAMLERRLRRDGGLAVAAPVARQPILRSDASG